MYAFWYFLIDKCLERQIVASWAHLSNSRQRPVGFIYQGIITLTHRVKHPFNGLRVLLGRKARRCGSAATTNESRDRFTLCTNDNVHSRWVPHRTGRTYSS